MNGQDRKDLNVILERMDQADKDRDNIHQDIKFIKENLFNQLQALPDDNPQKKYMINYLIIIILIFIFH